ncbi:hypothetical protein PLEOSDRAFT_1086598 [Pleurotus ostreatus PC15]|uniref:F-box domain-containing protein n=1 Tax=Pleurotus ostreatus (strain PC15) TaxID=1137138 RepID=A0A067NGG3_PLEO1|nr:hypothetical protein PLEOSDRAFT_1086598 [Pleurotus ostreatus PC15]
MAEVDRIQEIDVRAAAGRDILLLMSSTRERIEMILCTFIEPQNRHAEPETSPSLHIFERFLKQRKSLKKPVGEVSLVVCQITQEAVETFEKHAPIFWDGEDTYYEEDEEDNYDSDEEVDYDSDEEDDYNVDDIESIYGLMFGLSTRAIDATEVRRAIDEEIAERIALHEASIRNLKTRRNAYSNTSILPPEVLSKIFLAAKDGIPGYGVLKEASWLNVAGVCQEWRSIALASPRMWSSIDISKPNCALEFLKRSKSAPLRINCKTRPLTITAANEEMVKSIIAEVSRIEELEISAITQGEIIRFLSDAGTLTSLDLEASVIFTHLEYPPSASVAFTSLSPPLEEPDLSSLVKRCKRIEKLRLNDVHLPVFQTLIKSSKRKAKSPRLVPKLQTIELLRCTFIDPDNRYANLHDSPSFTVFERFLKQRKHCNMPVKDVLIEMCEVTEDAVARLEQYTDIAWDGEEMDSGEEEEDDYYDSDGFDDLYGFAGF